MHATYEKLLVKWKEGKDLERDDWEKLLQDGEDLGGLDAVLIALEKLEEKGNREPLERLLLTSICSGNGSVAIETSRLLGRKLDNTEQEMLLESMVLAGNVEDFQRYIVVDHPELYALVHTAIVLAVTRHLYKKSHGLFPNANLFNWPKIYVKELMLFELSMRATSSLWFPGSHIIVLKTISLERLIGALLMEGIISKECARAIIR
jgi:hypothetical protein